MPHTYYMLHHTLILAHCLLFPFVYTERQFTSFIPTVMNSKGRVVHFEIHADDPARAAVFYSAVFGWEINKWDGPQDYWLIMTGDKSKAGIDGGIVKRMGPAPGQMNPVSAYVCTIDVTNLDEMMVAVKDNGGSMALEKMEVPGVGWLAYCKDSEGNIFGMMQPLPQV